MMTSLKYSMSLKWSHFEKRDGHCVDPRDVLAAAAPMLPWLSRPVLPRMVVVLMIELVVWLKGYQSLALTFEVV
jgi:hypothetical protein